MAVVRRATTKDATWARAWTVDTVPELASVPEPRHGDVAFVVADGIWRTWRDDNTWEVGGGSPGAPGSQGPPGPPGLDGFDGVDGEAGPVGPPGSGGVAGPTGPTGAAGAPGMDGPEGETGEVGFPGPAGPTGATGAQGATGAAGSGIPGADGDVGEQGEMGVPGPAGVAGAAGAAGPQGVPGPTGAPGLDADDPEMPYVIPGPKGDTGPAGGGGGSATTVEKDLGSTATWRGSFTITDAAIAGSSKVLCWQAPGPYTGKGTRADEAEFQPVQVIAVVPATGSALVYWQTPPMLTFRKSPKGFLGVATAVFKDPQSVVHGPITRLGKVRGNVKFSYLVFA